MAIQSPTTPASIEQLRTFMGSPQEFWTLFTKWLGGAFGADAAAVLVSDRDQNGNGIWSAISTWKASGDRGTVPIDTFGGVAAQALHDGKGVYHENGRVSFAGYGLLLQTDDTEKACVAVLSMPGSDRARAAETCARLCLLSDTPAVYQKHRRLQQATDDAAHFAGTLDLMVLLNAQRHAIAAMMTFCNELATRFQCSRVALGWLAGHYVKVEAISHMEKFERKMEAVDLLEAAMEEALDQDEEIVWPAMEGENAIVRDHARYAASLAETAVVSLPLRLDGEAIGVLTLERDRVFTDLEIRSLRIIVDQAVRRLDDLRKADRWFGARWVHRLKGRFGTLLGPQHSMAKLVAISSVILLIVLFFVPWSYRVKAPFILRTEALAHIPAPFDGYIRDVPVRVGDSLTAGQVLLRLDDRELQHQEMASQAEVLRRTSEAQQAEATQKLAEMRISLAQAEQAKASLELAKFRRSQAEIKMPFDGVVVEGDLRERLSAPVKQGEILFVVARIEAMYAELKVQESDIHEVREGMTGEVAFASQPDTKYAFRVERIEPQAVSDPGGNVFIVRAVFPNTQHDWWRPGMSGMARIDVGHRRIIWVLLHRVIDFLHMKLWL